MALLATACLAASGCALPALVGGMAQSFEDTGSKTVFAEYLGLEGESFAIIVSAPRSIRGEHPRLVARLTNTMTNRLVAANDQVRATGFVPGPAILEFQYSTPSWEAWSYERLAQEFGVERLIMVDLAEYRTREPGNRYVWSGVVAARVGVIEADSGAPNEFAFTRDFLIRYPDSDGFTTADFSENHVEAALQDRIANRVVWLFYDHEEPNRLTY
jgi:hypothetical protein